MAMATVAAACAAAAGGDAKRSTPAAGSCVAGTRAISAPEAEAKRATHESVWKSVVASVALTASDVPPATGAAAGVTADRLGST